jgi:hypothetical protein
MNAFTDYQPQLTWGKHDTSRLSKGGSKGAAGYGISIHSSSKKIIPLMDIPSRDSINTEQTEAKAAKLKKARI